MAASKDERRRDGLPPDVQYDDRTDRVIWGKATDGFERLDWLRVAAAALDQTLHSPGTTQTIREMRNLLEEIVGEEEAIEVEGTPSHVVFEGDAADMPPGFWGTDTPGDFRMPEPPELVQCPGCFAPPERNFPKGQVYVGSGAGWAKCARCNGTGEVVKEAEGRGTR